MCQRAVQNIDALKTALQTADIVPQLLVQAQLSEQFDLLEEAAPHIRGAWSLMQAIPEGLRVTIQSRRHYPRYRLSDAKHACANENPR